MDIEEVGDLSDEATRHGIKHRVERIAIAGDEFEYKIDFGRNLVFKKGNSARKFIDALSSEHNLLEGSINYRAGFGWELK